MKIRYIIVIVTATMVMVGAYIFSLPDTMVSGSPEKLDIEISSNQPVIVEARAEVNTGKADYGYNLANDGLTVSIFWIRNNTEDDRRLIVKHDGQILLEVISPANSGYIEYGIDNFRMRTDDEGKLSYPDNTSITFDYP